MPKDNINRRLSRQVELRPRHAALAAPICPRAREAQEIPYFPFCVVSRWTAQLPEYSKTTPKFFDKSLI